MNRKKVLIVDDDESLLLTLEDGFKKYRDRIEPIFASSGKQAMEILKKEKIDLVVSDLRMKEIDGLDLLSFVVQEFPFIPFILITAYGSLPIKLKAESIGAVRYLEKPISMEKLIKTIFDIFDRELLMKEEFTFLSAAHLAQLVQYEGKTCTILVTSPEGKRGALHFDEGILVHAKTEKEEGLEAALEILSWENVHVVITKRLGKGSTITIEKPLEEIILEAFKIREERKTKQPQKGSEETEKPDEGQTEASYEDRKKDEEDTAEIPSFPEREDASPEEQEEAEGPITMEDVLKSLRTVPEYLGSAIFSIQGDMVAFDAIRDEVKIKEFFKRMAALYSMANTVYEKAGAGNLSVFISEFSEGNFVLQRKDKTLLMLLQSPEGDPCLAKYNFDRTLELLNRI